MSTETPQFYFHKDLQFINSYATLVKDAASKIAPLSLNSRLLSSSRLELYIAGFVAEEYHDRSESLYDLAGQALADWYILNRVTESKLQGSVASIDADQALWDLRGGDKFEYPALIDVGPGNIQIYTAVRLIREYSAAYPTSDPLGILPESCRGYCDGKIFLSVENQSNAPGIRAAQLSENIARYAADAEPLITYTQSTPPAGYDEAFKEVYVRRSDGGRLTEMYLKRGGRGGDRICGMPPPCPIAGLHVSHLPFASASPEY